MSRRRDGPDWVARVFAADRPIAAAEGDAALLRRLEQQNFPAERCAAQEPVSAHEGQGVLITRHVEGTRADGSRRTFARLGGLLGRLHALPSDHVRDGGGWHHLVHQDTPAAEIAAARSLLDAAAPALPPDQRPLLAALRAELDRADGCADLPQALIHPDFVPVNAIAASDGGLVMVDWTGAGRGPRLSPLAFLLWAAGCRGPSRLDAVVASYREHITPTGAELGRLAGAIWARPLTVACWAVLAGRKGLAETVADLAADRELADPLRRPGGSRVRRRGGPGPDWDQSHGREQPPGRPRDRPPRRGRSSPAPRHGLTGGCRRYRAGRRRRARAGDGPAGPSLRRPAGRDVRGGGGLDPASPPGGRRGAALRVWVVGRTVFLDDLLAGASQQGCRQIVLLGAGFDARAFRLPWPPGTRCFEVDTPDVLVAKDEVLEAAHASPACERIVVPCDLRNDWPAALRAAGLDPGRPTAWIAEGLLAYLSPADVDRLMDAVTGLSAPRSWLGLTMTTRVPGEEALRRSRAPADPAGWLAGLGWAAEVSDLRQVLRAHGRPLPERPGPERPGPEDDERPRGLLIQATLDHGHGRPARDPDPPAARARQARRPRRRDQAGTTLVADLRFPALLSQALVAFTIEFDNESERQLPHRTTWGPAARSGRGPWLVSLAMWANFLRFLPANGVALRDVADLVPLVNLTGLERWGYVTVGPDPADGRPAAPRRDAIVRPTTWGRRAQDIYQPLVGLIGERWRERFGAAVIGQLTGALRALAGPSGDALPGVPAGFRGPPARARP